MFVSLYHAVNGLWLPEREHRMPSQMMVSGELVFRIVYYIFLLSIFVSRQTMDPLTS